MGHSDELNHVIINDNFIVYPNPIIAKFTLYPNPNDGAMELLYQIPNNTNAKLTITDITGRIIDTYTLTETEGTLPINLRHLNEGIYFYNINRAAVILKHDKFVIIK